MKKIREITSLILLSCLLFCTGCGKESVSVQPMKLMITYGGGGNVPCIMEIKADGNFEVKSGEGIYYYEGKWEEGEEKLRQKSKKLSKKERELLSNMIATVEENREKINNDYKMACDSIDIIAEIGGYTYQSSYDPLPHEKMNELQALTYKLVEISPLKLDKIYKHYADMVLEENKKFDE